jgi:anti-sigma factor RsiW
MNFSRSNPSKCRHVARVIQSYLDDELDEQRRSAVELHLQACRDCGLDAYSFEQLKMSVARLQVADDELIGRLREFGESLEHGHTS